MYFCDMKINMMNAEIDELKTMLSDREIEIVKLREESKQKDKINVVMLKREQELANKIKSLQEKSKVDKKTIVMLQDLIEMKEKKNNKQEDSKRKRKIEYDLDDRVDVMEQAKKSKFNDRHDSELDFNQKDEMSFFSQIYQKFDAWCVICKDKHRRRDCPAEVCYICNLRGHVSYWCQQAVCRNCNIPGHKSAVCSIGNGFP